jgi:hypothetical protein
MVQDTPKKKFVHPEVTAKGETRAWVDYAGTRTLWFNTGTLCNIECKNCYIESSPKNDRLVYLTAADVAPFLDELDAAGESNIEIGFTGGEPFMAPEILGILALTLDRGHDVLVLTNAMQPMMRPRVREGLEALHAAYPGKLTLRVSLDHHTAEYHDAERGEGAFERALMGLEWLASVGIRTAIAGRTIWGESDADCRAGYAALCDAHGLQIDTSNPTELVLFPEMEMDADPPEITTACWGILNKHPDSLMCASQRMVVKRKGAERPSVLACTLIPYDERFELGHTLEESRKAVPLNHVYCASFCVLGGGSCSA